MTAAGAVALAVRYLMVMLFLPFSALDKVLGFDHAVAQTQQVFRPRPLATAVLIAGLAIETVCTLGVVAGVADRAAALVIALYCWATALLFKRFWMPGDFWADPDGRARGLFWDCLKNISLGAGFLLLVVGSDGRGLAAFVADPLASTHPYRSTP